MRFSEGTSATAPSDEVQRQLALPLEECFKCQRLQKTLTKAGIENLGDLLGTSPQELQTLRDWTASSWSRLSLNLRTLAEEQRALSGIIEDYVSKRKVFRRASLDEKSNADSKPGKIGHRGFSNQGDGCSEVTGSLATRSSFFDQELSDVISDLDLLTALRDEGLNRLADLLGYPPRMFKDLVAVGGSGWTRLRKMIELKALVGRYAEDRNLLTSLLKDYFEKDRVLHEGLVLATVQTQIPLECLNLEKDSEKFLTRLRVFTVEELLAYDPEGIAQQEKMQQWWEIKNALKDFLGKHELWDQASTFIGQVDEIFSRALIDEAVQTLDSAAVPLRIPELLSGRSDRQISYQRELLQEALVFAAKRGLVYEIDDDYFTSTKSLHLPSEVSHRLQRLALQSYRPVIDCSDIDWRPDLELLRPEQVAYALSSCPQLVRTSFPLFVKNLKHPRQRNGLSGSLCRELPLEDTRLQTPRAVSTFLQKVGITRLHHLGKMLPVELIENYGLTQEIWKVIAPLLVTDFFGRPTGKTLRKFAAKVDRHLQGCL